MLEFAKVDLETIDLPPSLWYTEETHNGCKIQVPTVHRFSDYTGHNAHGYHKYLRSVEHVPNHPAATRFSEMQSFFRFTLEIPYNTFVEIALDVWVDLEFKSMVQTPAGVVLEYEAQPICFYSPEPDSCPVVDRLAQLPPVAAALKNGDFTDDDLYDEVTDRHRCAATYAYNVLALTNDATDIVDEGLMSQIGNKAEIVAGGVNFFTHEYEADVKPFNGGTLISLEFSD